MSATIFRSAERPDWDCHDSRDAPKPDEWLSIDATVEVEFAEPAARGDALEDGLPLALVELYADIAARHAVTREVDPGVWVALVNGLEGVWADGGSAEEALAALPEAVVGWVAVKRRLGFEVPPMEGIDLNLP